MYSKLIKTETGWTCTPDLKYALKENSDGFAYWYRISDSIRLGDYSYDYTFINDHKDALKKLNRMLQKELV